MKKSDLINNLKDVPDNAELVCVTPLGNYYHIKEENFNKYEYDDNKYMIPIV